MRSTQAVGDALRPVPTEPVKVMALTSRAVEHRLADHRAPAHDEVEHALGQAGAVQDVDDAPRRSPGTRSAGLKTTRVAVGQRRRDLPGRDGDREIPRRDDADDADRLAGDLDADARAHRGHDLAGEAQRLAGEELEDLRGADGLADALGAGSCPPRATAGGRARPCAPGSRCRRLRQDLVRAAAGRSGTMPGTRPWRRRWPLRACARSAAGIFADDVVGVRRVDVAATPAPPTHSPSMRLRCSMATSPLAWPGRLARGRPATSAGLATGTAGTTC